MNRMRVAATYLVLLGLTAACSDGGDSDAATETVITDTDGTDTTAAPAPSDPSTTEPAGTSTASPLHAISGTVSYAAPDTLYGIDDPRIMLTDLSGTITGGNDLLPPIESQVFGRITSDIQTSPFTYELDLPAVPRGTLHDLDNDTVDESGVMVFSVGFQFNAFGDDTLDERDLSLSAWTQNLSSLAWSIDPEAGRTITGGRLLTYAPAGAQAFPSGFGADGRLFTDDDPSAPAPQGWSLVDLTSDPFRVSQSGTAEVDLIESGVSPTLDLSAMSYTESFDALVDAFREQYAFTEVRGIDWDALAARFRPQVEAATTPEAFAATLDAFERAIPDAGQWVESDLLNPDGFAPWQGGLGFAIREADDGSAMVTFVTPGSPADEVGIQVGATVSSLGGVPIADVIDATPSAPGSFSSAATDRLQQYHYATRFPLESDPQEVTFTNPGRQPRTATLAVVDEFDSFVAESFYAGVEGSELPVELTLLPDGTAQITLMNFYGGSELTVRLWEHALQTVADNGIESIVVDLRWNDGGYSALADLLAAYFFDEPTVVGGKETYDPTVRRFVRNPLEQAVLIPPPVEQRFTGAVAVLVGPGTFGAAELFADTLASTGRATIVGYGPTDGTPGETTSVAMPEGITVYMTTTRFVDAAGRIRLAGSGVVPDVEVPVNIDTAVRKANGEDVVLSSALAALA